MFSNNSTTKIASTDSPSHKPVVTSNQQQQDNLTNKLSNSFIRTATLPRRFKEKFLNKNLPQDQSIQSITSQHSNDCNEQQQQHTQQQSNEMICNLNKLLNKYFKTIKYLEQIINKKKYEIIASSTTATLESVLDIYNLIITFNLSSDDLFKQCRNKINKSLASLIKWSDSILLTLDCNANDLSIEPTASKLIKHLNKSIKNLIKYLRMSELDLVKSISSYSSSSPSMSTLSSMSSSSSDSSLSMSTSPPDKASSLSSASSSFINNNNINKTPVASDKISDDYLEVPKYEAITTTTTIDEKTGTKTTQTTIHKKSLPNLTCSSFSLQSNSSTGATANTYITQTSTLTTTTTNSSHMNSDLLLSNKTAELAAFFDLDRLVLELSELSNERPFEQIEQPVSHPSFTNEQCDYLVTQFESFAKNFKNNNNFDTNSSVSSTLNRSNYSGSTHLSQTNQNKKTLHSSKVFKHDLDQKLCVIESIIKDLKLEDDDLLKIKTTENEFKQIEENLAENGRILTRLIDHKTLNKKDFIETNMVLDDKPIDDILKSNDPVRSFMSLFDNNKQTQKTNVTKRERRRSVTSSSSSELSPDHSNRSSLSVLNQKDTKTVDSVDEEDDEDGNCNQVIFGANNLNPQFLLIDDDEDEELLNKTNINYTADDDDINDYKDNLIDQLKKDDDLKIKKLIDDSISITSYNLISLKLEKDVTKLSTWSLVSTKINEDSQLTTLPSTVRIQEQNVLDLLDVNHLLEYQTSNSTSNFSKLLLKPPPTNILRGGHIDALVVLATSANTNVISAVTSSKSKLNPDSLNLNEQKGNFLFQEAFLTTYRTIIEPIDLINKLIYRYRLFSKYASNKNLKTSSKMSSSQTCSSDDKFDLNRLKSNIKNNKLAASAARNSLALLVRVLDDLGNELNEKIIETFADFVYELLIDNELQLARLLRKKLLYKLDTKRNDQLVKEKLTVSTHSIKKSNGNLDSVDSVPYSLNSFTKRSNQSILDFKSIDLAQQITLIDLNLFLKIELSEVLLWSTKQSEKHSPNLIKFTEHFNKISYWARSRILEHDSIKEREKIVIKFLKIMKHLRKFNNFNSYLSILSAVDSGPIQRLDWPKSLTDSVKEFAALIDPKCGFKCLREAVVDAQPPCIPHIGLILQDLTILHIANSDYLPSGNCNFWKRWQQFNILERLRCFRRCNYDFKPDAKIQKFFKNFEDYFGEDAQYSLSEQLKPRSKH